MALSLSDAFCVDRHRDELNRLLDDHVDILFANETEALSMTRCSDFDSAVRALKGRAEHCVVTRGATGATVLTRDELVHVAAEPVSRVVDTTGAGDLFAAGYLCALSRGHNLATALRFGAVAAAEIISHVGARPAASLAELVRSKGL